MTQKFRDPRPIRAGDVRMDPLDGEICTVLGPGEKMPGWWSCKLQDGRVVDRAPDELQVVLDRFAAKEALA